MSTVELAVERVKRLDEAKALRLLAWLEAQQPSVSERPAPVGAEAMLGYARKFRAAPRPTSEWIEELRAGDCD